MTKRKSHLIYYLIALASLIKTREFAKVPTREFAAAVGTSQQNASKILAALEKAGYVERRVVKRVTHVRLTELALRELEKIRAAIEGVVPTREIPLKLTGRIFTGLREGAYYISLAGYREPIKKLLGFDPYPGTLNVRADNGETKAALALLRSLPGTVIPGFFSEGREYGAIKLFKCKVEGRVGGAVIFAERTHYGPDVFEVIAPVYLRGLLKLRDGDRISVMVYLA
jgi:riboflavin kinase